MHQPIHIAEMPTELSILAAAFGDSRCSDDHACWRVAFLYFCAPRRVAVDPGPLSRRADVEALVDDSRWARAVFEVREVQDQINAGLLLPLSACSKYNVRRQLEAAPSAMNREPIAILNAA